jgi:hypothetical protein
MLNGFALSTGLTVNVHKSSMDPINVTDETMKDLAAAFGCQVAFMPFTYLVLPLGTARPQRSYASSFQIEKEVNQYFSFSLSRNRLSPRYFHIATTPIQ